MKKFKFLTMALAIFILSCENDGGTSNIPLNDGAAPNLIKSASTDGFFNLIRLNNGAAALFANAIDTVSIESAIISLDGNEKRIPAPY